MNIIPFLATQIALQSTTMALQQNNHYQIAHFRSKEEKDKEEKYIPKHAKKEDLEKEQVSM